MRFDRIDFPMPTGDPDSPVITAYGFVEVTDEGQPTKHYACSATPFAWVEIVGYHEEDMDCSYDGFYANWYSAKKYLRGEPFSADSEDDAREECHGNW